MVVLLSSVVDHGHDIRVVVLKQVKAQVNFKQVNKTHKHGENKERKIQKYLGKRGYR